MYKIIYIKGKISECDKQRSENKTTDGLKRIHLILNKILLLTMCYEISFLFLLIPTLMQYEYFQMPVIILAAIDSIVPAVIIYLMVEHNHKIYDKLCCDCRKENVNHVIDVIDVTGNTTTSELGRKVNENENNSTFVNCTNGTHGTKITKLTKESVHEFVPDSAEIDSERTTTSDLKRYNQINKKVLDKMRSKCKPIVN